MRIFAAVSPDDTAPRTAVPVEILRRLAFGRPQRRTIQPALPTPTQSVQAASGNIELADLDERVRASGEW